MHFTRLQEEPTNSLQVLAASDGGLQHRTSLASYNRISVVSVSTLLTEYYCSEVHLCAATDFHVKKFFELNPSNAGSLWPVYSTFTPQSTTHRCYTSKTVLQHTP